MNGSRQGDQVFKGKWIRKRRHKKNNKMKEGKGESEDCKEEFYQRSIVFPERREEVIAMKFSRSGKKASVGREKKEKKGTVGGGEGANWMAAERQ